MDSMGMKNELAWPLFFSKIIFEIWARANSIWPIWDLQKIRGGNCKGLMEFGGTIRAV